MVLTFNISKKRIPKTRNPLHSFVRYLYYLLFAFDIVKGFYGMGSGVRQGLNYDEVKRIAIVVPPLPVQRAIAAFLDEKCGAIDEAIVEAKKGIEEYKAWKKSLIFEVVTGKRRVGFFNAESQRGREFFDRINKIYRIGKKS